MKFEIINSTTNRTFCESNLTTSLIIFYPEKAFAGDFRFPIRGCFGSAGKNLQRLFLLEILMSKEIQLTKGQVVIVDDEDFERVNQYRWTAVSPRCYQQTMYWGIRSERRGGKKISILLHRFIMNAPKGVMVDHKDRNTLNCQKSNLRLCTNAENQRNTPSKVTNTTGYKGVCLRKTDKKFTSGIRFNRKLIFLGSYSDPKEAAKAYDAKAKELFGEFAYLNFPEQEDIQLSKNIGVTP